MCVLCGWRSRWDLTLKQYELYENIIALNQVWSPPPQKKCAGFLTVAINKPTPVDFPKISKLYKTQHSPPPIKNT